MNYKILNTYYDYIYNIAYFINNEIIYIFIF